MNDYQDIVGISEILSEVSDNMKLLLDRIISVLDPGSSIQLVTEVLEPFKGKYILLIGVKHPILIIGFATRDRKSISIAKLIMGFICRDILNINAKNISIIGVRLIEDGSNTFAADIDISLEQYLSGLNKIKEYLHMDNDEFELMFRMM